MTGDAIATLLRDIGRSIVASVTTEAQAAMPSNYAAAYLSGVKTEASDDEVIVAVVGKVPNFLERGLGPAGVGDSGPFDIRKFVLKNGKTRQAVQVAPGVFRTMSATGKPWMHPGFQNYRILPKAAAAALRRLA